MRESVSSPGPHGRRTAHSHNHGMAARYRSPWPDTHWGRNSGAMGGSQPGAAGERELQARLGPIWVDSWSACGTYFPACDGQIRAVSIHRLT